jgi:hypothetical protein
MKRAVQASPSVKMIVWALIVATFLSIWFPPEAGAMIAPAGLAQESNSVSNREEDMRTVQRALESKVIRQRLADYGLTPKEINARLASLSDNQLHQMASQIDAQMPGGDAGLSILITVLVIAILVVLFLYIARRA